MKRSGRARFAVEAAFLIVVATGAALAGLSPLRIIVLMLAAGLLVVLIERASTREHARAVAGPTDDDAVAGEARAGFTGRLRREPPEEPETIVEEAPASAVTKRPLELPGREEPEPELGPKPVAAPPQAVETHPPPEAERAVIPAAPTHQTANAPAPREWNIWDLERRAREQARDAARDEEWTALFVHMRQFANPEGVLPVEFDGLVRESFAELIQAA